MPATGPGFQVFGASNCPPDSLIPAKPGRASLPGPDLTRRAGFVTGRRLAPDGRIGPATVMLLPLCAQDAVKAGFRGQIVPLIGQSGNDLAWRQAGKFRKITDAWNGGAFLAERSQSWLSLLRGSGCWIKGR